MDVWVELEVPSKGVDNSHNGRRVSKLILGMK